MRAPRDARGLVTVPNFHDGLIRSVVHGEDRITAVLADWEGTEYELVMERPEEFEATLAIHGLIGWLEIRRGAKPKVRLLRWLFPRYRGADAELAAEYATDEQERLGRVAAGGATLVVVHRNSDLRPWLLAYCEVASLTRLRQTPA